MDQDLTRESEDGGQSEVLLLADETDTVDDGAGPTQADFPLDQDPAEDDPAPRSVGTELRAQHPRFLHFYVVLGIVIALLVSGSVVFYLQSKKATENRAQIIETRDRLVTANNTLAEDTSNRLTEVRRDLRSVHEWLERVDGQLQREKSDRIDEGGALRTMLASKIGEANARLDELSELANGLGSSVKELNEAFAGKVQELTERMNSASEDRERIRSSVDETRADLGDVGATLKQQTQELEKGVEEANQTGKTLTKSFSNLREEHEILLSTLGKKAEKGYVDVLKKRMDRLDDGVKDVSQMVSSVTRNLEEVKTGLIENIQKLTGDMEQMVEESVGSRLDIKFEPSTVEGN